jgi:AcrR family transcriptional regulator
LNERSVYNLAAKMGRNPVRDRIQIEQTRSRLIEAGRQVILERGLQQSRVRDIVARAGIGVGTFYSHFKDLGQFQTEVIRQATEEVRSQIREIRGMRDRSVLQDPVASIRRSIETFYDFIDQNYQMALLLLRERTGGGLYAQFIRQQFELFSTDLQEDLEEAAKYGVAVKGIPHDLAAEAILGMNLQLAESYAERRVAEGNSSKQVQGKLSRQAAKDRERVISALTQITVRGLLEPVVYSAGEKADDGP